jgi:hypothetical protein
MLSDALPVAASKAIRRTGLGGGSLTRSFDVSRIHAHSPPMPERPSDLDALLTISGQLEALPPLKDHPDLEALRRTFLDQSRATVSRLVPSHIAKLEQEHGWAASFNRRMELVTDRLLAGPDPNGALIGKAELRRSAPSFGHVSDALTQRPDLLAKVQQGFVQPLPVPIGLPPSAFVEPLAQALRQYADAGTLRATDGSPQQLNRKMPVWMWEGYTDADRSGELVYFPQRFSPDHGGKTKEQLLRESPFPGWQVLLLEGLRNIPRQGRGQTVGGRPQLEANRTPRQYLKLLATAPTTTSRA